LSAEKNIFVATHVPQRLINKAARQADQTKPEMENIVIRNEMAAHKHQVGSA
jgi:hypothetical protein